MSHKDDFMLQKQVMLGGKVTRLYEEFRDIARLTPDYALVKKILKEEGADKEDLDLIDYLGMCEFVRYSEEISRLSMVIGDETTISDVEKAMADARQSRPNTQT